MNQKQVTKNEKQGKKIDQCTLSDDSLWFNKKELTNF